MKFLKGPYKAFKYPVVQTRLKSYSQSNRGHWSWGTTNNSISRETVINLGEVKRTENAIHPHYS